MSFNFGGFNDFNSINKAQASYKDGGGMGGGGMYMRQKKKRKEDEQDKDIFEFSKDKDSNETEIEEDIKKESEIPSDTLFNKFVNWFRLDQ